MSFDIRGQMGVLPVRSACRSQAMHLGDAARLCGERAENARTIAGQMTDPEARLGMLEIARDYAIMAEYAERRARGAFDQADKGEPAQTAALEIGWDLPQRNLV